LEYYFKIVELINCVHTKEPLITEENETADIFGDVKVPELNQLQFKQPMIDQQKVVESFQIGLANFLDLSLTPLIDFLNSISTNISGEVENNNVAISKNLNQLKELINTGIDKIQRKYKDDLNAEMFNAEGYVDDFLDQIDVYQGEIVTLLNEIKEIVEVKVNSLLKEKFGVLKTEFSRDYDVFHKKIVDFNSDISVNLDNLAKIETSLNSLSEKIDSIKETTLEKIQKMQKETSDASSKKQSKALGILAELNKKSQKFLTNMKAAVLILESTKTPIFERLIN
ncbi:unnamed protein product, partial [marine sediment metagenome]